MFFRTILPCIIFMMAPVAGADCVRLHVGPSVIEADNGVFELIIEAEPSCALAADETLLLRVKRPGGEEVISTTLESWLVAHEMEPGAQAGVLSLEVELNHSVLAARTILVVAGEAADFDIIVSDGRSQDGTLLTVEGARDALGNALPDGTVVEFAITSNDVPLTLRQVPLINGRAKANLEPAVLSGFATVSIRIGDAIQIWRPILLRPRLTG